MMFPQNLRKVSLGVLCFALSCTGKRVKENPTPASTQSSAQGASAAGKSGGSLASNSLAMLIIAKLKANMKAKSDLSDSQIDGIGDAAEKKIVATSPKQAGLVQEVSGGNINDFIDDLAEGALESLGDPSFADLEVSKVQNILKIIIESSLQSLKGNATSLDEGAKKTMLTDIMKKIVGALDNAGFDHTEIADAVEVSLETAVSHLDEAGILTDTNAADLIGALIKGAVLGSIRGTSSSLNLSLNLSLPAMLNDEEEDSEVDSDTGEGVESGEEDPEDESKDSDGDGIPDSMESTESDDPEEVDVGELPPDGDFAELDGFDPGAALGGDASDEEVAAAMYFSMLSGTVGALNDAGFDTQKILVLTPITIRNLLETLGTAGVTQKAIQQYLGFAIQGATEGLANTGLVKPDDLSHAVAAVVVGAIQSLKTVGFPEDQYGRLLSVIITSAVSQIDDLKLIPKTEFGRTCAIILSEATVALKSLGVSKTQKDRLVPLIANLISAAISKLDDLGLSDDDAIAFVTTATGAVFGSLDQLGFAAEDLEAIGEDLIDDLKTALVKINKDLFDDLDYSELDFDADSDIDDDTAV